MNSDSGASRHVRHYTKPNTTLGNLSISRISRKNSFRSTSDVSFKGSINQGSLQGSVAKTFIEPDNWWQEHRTLPSSIQFIQFDAEETGCCPLQPSKKSRKCFFCFTILATLIFAAMCATGIFYFFGDQINFGRLSGDDNDSFINEATTYKKLCDGIMNTPEVDFDFAVCDDEGGHFKCVDGFLSRSICSNSLQNCSCSPGLLVRINHENSEGICANDFDCDAQHVSENIIAALLNP